MPLIDSDGTKVTLYQYVPNQTAAYIFIAVFGVGTLAHVFFMFRYRAAFFIPLVIGGVCEAFGYYGRAWGHDEPQSVKAYILQSLLLLVAPIFLAATIYMALGRIIRALDGNSHSMIRPNWLTKIFVLGDILCFCTQMGGAGMQSTTDASIVKMGGTVVLAGLVLQIAIFCCFVLVAWNFHIRLSKQPTPASAQHGISWPRYMRALYAASLFILVRNVVRVFEYAEDSTTGFVATHEAMIYIFDALLMAAAVGIFLVLHPGRLVLAARRYGKIRDSDGAPVALLERAGKAEMSSPRIA